MTRLTSRIRNCRLAGANMSFPGVPFPVGAPMKIASALMLNDHQKALIHAACPDAEIVCPAQRPRSPVVWDSEVLDPLVKDADVLIGHRARAGLAEFAPRLRWIQFLGAGIDHLKLTDLLLRTASS